MEVLSQYSRGMIPLVYSLTHILTAIEATTLCVGSKNKVFKITLAPVPDCGYDNGKE